MHLWNVPGLVLLVVEAVIHRNARGFSLFVAATALWAAAVVLTFTLMFSQNSRRLRFLIEKITARHLPRLLIQAVALLCLLLPSQVSAHHESQIRGN
jgi:hypothetical protein